MASPMYAIRHRPIGGTGWEIVKEIAEFSNQKPTRSQHKQEFSEDALRDLAELDARCVPSGVDSQPAFEKPFRQNSRLSPKFAAGGGILIDPDGSKRPHYWGNRKRLRTRFLTGGHKAMPEYELLELLLFNAIERIDVKPLAKRLLATFGDLNGVVAASEHRLLKVEGATSRVYPTLE